MIDKEVISHFAIAAIEMDEGDIDEQSLRVMVRSIPGSDKGDVHEKAYDNQKTIFGDEYEYYQLHGVFVLTADEYVDLEKEHEGEVPIWVSDMEEFAEIFGKWENPELDEGKLDPSVKI